jgi:hypothetical protein
MLLVAIIVITIVICICNKRCPLYKRRQREPPVVVIDGVQPAPEENAHESLSLIKNDQFNTPKGACYVTLHQLLVSHGQTLYCSNNYNI